MIGIIIIILFSQTNKTLQWSNTADASEVASIAGKHMEKLFSLKQTFNQ
ncbi:hypothetical protein SBF1_6550002 [Candidatus Desulfosporosinus infrequens]|uniref:Uncharacterized protein n=1 Tax=Candidatus Desulfosporosinus infrequens TaxID=2043169 RepID=A0A2U3LN99_9FIRM|nr:hypothetical protein SBF1_6550002 [Candidatus Desulfosporosinus infrequens]